MPGKPKFATAWLGGCSGCHMSFLDLDERLMDLAEIVDVCYSPFADVKEFPEAVDITLVEGAVANEDNLRDLRRIRERTKILVAFGDCAVTGNVTVLRNLFSVEEVLQRVFRESSVVAGLPGANRLVPALLPQALRLHDVVAVDYFLPGCPPSADAIFSVILDLVQGRTPETAGIKFGS
jgi:NAD-reducing hydrogenase small subunit